MNAGRLTRAGTYRRRRVDCSRWDTRASACGKGASSDVRARYLSEYVHSGADSTLFERKRENPFLWYLYEFGGTGNYTVAIGIDKLTRREAYAGKINFNVNLAQVTFFCL